MDADAENIEELERELVRKRNQSHTFAEIEGNKMEGMTTKQIKNQVRKLKANNSKPSVRSEKSQPADWVMLEIARLLIQGVMDIQVGEDQNPNPTTGDSGIEEAGKAT